MKKTIQNTIQATLFALSTALAAPAYSVETDGTICLHLAMQKHKAQQALGQDASKLEKLLKESKECAEVDVKVTPKGRYGWETTGGIACYRDDSSVAHQYDLASVDSVAVAGGSKVRVAFKSGKKRSDVLYTLPEAAKAEKTQEAFQQVMEHYWALKG